MQIPHYVMHFGDPSLQSVSVVGRGGVYCKAAFLISSTRERLYQLQKSTFYNRNLRN